MTRIFLNPIRIGNGNGRFFSFNFIQETIELNFSCQLLHYTHSMMISEHKNLDSAQYVFLSQPMYELGTFWLSMHM